MVTIKSKREIELMKKAGKVVALTYQELEKHIKPIIAILNGQLGFYPPDYDIQETNEQRLIRINKYYNR